MARLAVPPLPELPSAAAVEFHRTVMPQAAELLSGEVQYLTLLFAPADHTHRTWRLAAVQALAREHAPARVNAIASEGGTGVSAALTYLEAAEGVTGQYLPLDDAGAGPVIQEPG
jgi:hypothetical protein